LEKCALLVFVFNKATNLDVVGENSLRTWIKSFRLLQYENEEMEQGILLLPLRHG
jgi:hypothetical protein